MATAPTASPIGSSGDSPSVVDAADAGLGATASSADSEPSAGVAAEGSATGSVSPGSTRRPSCGFPASPPGVAKPQSSRRSACSVVETGKRSVCIRLTTRRRPSRSAAATKVCRAASVNPVFPPRVPGYSVSRVFWDWIW
ncbi:hypothetical protein ASG41_02115 [Modestobacter sp. Leaf380]|nr:hypothetical protein ASG41_02115 [Modestobacter sp. Leaf380]